MENRKLIKFLIPIFMLGFFIVNINNVFAYDIETHAYLTSEIFDFYNKNFFNQKISDELKNYLIDGSRREDDPIRWMNHFFDPVYNRGLTVDPKIFSVKDIASVSLVNTATFGSKWLSLKEWAQDKNNQNKFKYAPVIATILSSLQSNKIQKYFSTSDFTWDAAINYWINDDKEMAMFTLGHILHLVEDASVPDHTRNDPHPGDSPYELYTQQFTLDNKDNSLEKRLNNKNPFILDNLNYYFDELAKYSNNNFYSKDTIGIQSGYKLPEMDYLKKDGDYYYAVKENKDGNYYLFLYKNYKNSLIIESKNNIVLKLDDENKVINDYWSRLSTKSIQYGAGVVNLFFQEVEKAKNDQNFSRQPEKSFLNKTVDAVKNVFASAVSSISLIISSGNNIQQLSADVNKIITKNFQENISENKDVVIPIEIKNQTIENSKIIEQQTQQIQEVQQIITKPKEEIKIQQTIQKIEKTIQNNQATSSQTTNTQIASNKIVFKYTGNSGSGSSYSSGGSSSGNSGSASVPSAPKTYPKILINEIQLSSTLSVHEEFVELYNPNDASVDLTDWYIQKETKSGTSSISTFASNNLFFGKIIGAKSFLLIAHPSSTFNYDIAADYGISDNNTLVIKNPNGEIVDKVGWGTANDCEGPPAGGCASNPLDGQSIQRKIQSENFIDTDNNAQDFEIQTCPSPKTQTNADCTQTNAETATSTSTETAATSTISHLVISEIYPDKTGNNFDFVELYNPTNSSVELKNYSLKIRKESATSTSSLSSFSSSHTIAAKSFFLVGLDNYGSSTYSTADILRTSHSLFTSTSSIVYLMDNNAVIDEVAYNPSSSNLSNGQSLERKAYSTSTIDLMTTGEHRFFGNEYDTNSADDFVLRNSAEPQNSQNFPEPRSAPTIPQNFNIQYNSDTMSLDLSWDTSQDYNNSTSTIIYKIIDISVASTTFSETETTSTTHSFPINETGRDYNFSIQAFDGEGLSSATSSASISIPYSTLIIARQSDKSISEQGTGNGQFYQYLGNGLLGFPKNITFHAKFLSGSNNPAHYFEAVFWQSDSPDYANLTQVSSNICYRDSIYGPENNCPDFGFQYDIDKDYIIPVQQNFVFDPSKYYKVKFYTFQATAVFYGSSDVDSYKYGKTARDNSNGNETDSSAIKDLYFKIEATAPIEIPASIFESVPQNFEVDYSVDTLELSLTWDKPRYFDENSPALTYEIIDTESILPEINTSTTSTIITINEVGKKYKFSIQAFDGDGNSTIEAESKEIFIPYSLLSQFIIAQQPDYSVSEIGTGNGEFYQTIGNNISGELGAIAVKAGPPGHYILIWAFQYNDSNYSIPENILEIAFCTANPQIYPGPLCSDYYVVSDTITVPAKNDFVFNPEKYYKLYFQTFQSRSTFYGSPDADSYPNGQSTKNSGGMEIPTSPIQDVYFKILSSTVL